MIRLFEQHQVRRQKELEGIWDFVTEDGRSFSLPVPGCWEQQPELINFRGKGTYIKKIYITQRTNLRLECKGVSHTADVYFDDVFLMHHYNAYTPFSGVIHEVLPGEHTIRIEVDNSFSEKSSLHIPNDYYTYGGIIRPVVLEEISDIYIENVHFTPRLEVGKWTGEIEVDIRNIGNLSNSVDIVCHLSNENIIEKSIQINVNAKEHVVIKHAFDNVKAWNIENPRLYMMQIQLSQNGIVTDDFIERVGFREVSLQQNKLCLNGKPIFLRGFNRHEDYGVIGCAIPPQLMA